MELRWFVEEWTEYMDGLAIKRTEKPVLQYKPISVVNYMNGVEIEYGEWTTVPVVYEEK